jgi:Zn-dependent peptidase ImmA (M78 family)
VGEGRALEREANVFAAELLMPGKLVRERFDGAVDGTAAVFGVSEEAMGWRLYNMGVVRHPPPPRGLQAAGMRPINRSDVSEEGRSRPR